MVFIPDKTTFVADEEKKGLTTFVADKETSFVPDKPEGETPFFFKLSPVLLE